MICKPDYLEKPYGMRMHSNSPSSVSQRAIPVWMMKKNAILKTF